MILTLFYDIAGEFYFYKIYIITKKEVLRMATYTIKKGDTLSQLAKQYGTTVDALTKANKISDPNKIYAGKNLSIPGSGSANTSTTKKTTKATNNAKTNTQSTVPKAVKQTALSKVENTKPTYSQSDDVSQALSMLNQQEGAKPAAYQSSYQQQIQDLLGKITNRESFSYDMNADPLYQQYKNQYTRQADLAMRDTIGNTSALTGGYGSSYGTIAGSQAYDSQIANLNNVIPDLYNAALNQYNSEGNVLYNQLGAIQGQDQIEYGRYSDSVNDYRNDLNYYYTKYNNMSTEDYNRYLNDLGSWESDRSYYYGKEQDSLAQQNYLNEFDYKKEQDVLAQTNYDKQFAYQKTQDALTQQNYLQELAMQKAQADQQQSNWQKQFDYNAQNSSKKKDAKGLKGATSGTTSTSKTSTQNTDYSGYVENTVKKQGLDAAISYIKRLYDNNRISEADFEKLYLVANKTNTNLNMGSPGRSIRTGAFDIKNMP
jgi:hypothetical protein